jgi:hypothetical protein
VETEIEHHLEGCSDCHLVFDAAINTLDRYFATDRVVGNEITPRAA